MPAVDEAARSAEIARLHFLARKVAMVHGPSHPAMVDLGVVVGRIAARPTEAVGEADRTELVRLTAGFAPWEGACASVRSLYAGLSALS